MNWISVKDRLPEKERAVLIYAKGGYTVSWWYGWEDDPGYPIEGPITELLAAMSKGFHWSDDQVRFEYYIDNKRFDYINREEYDNIYWMYLPEKP